MDYINDMRLDSGSLIFEVILLIVFFLSMKWVVVDDIEDDLCKEKWWNFCID